MPGSRDKVEKIIRKLVELYDDPHVGVITWASTESIYLQKLCNALGQLGFCYQKCAKDK